jgi:hypothetical protein
MNVDKARWDASQTDMEPAGLNCRGRLIVTTQQADTPDGNVEQRCSKQFARSAEFETVTRLRARGYIYTAREAPGPRSTCPVCAQPHLTSLPLL